MHPHKEAIIRTFFVREKRHRYISHLKSPKRSKALDALNHLWGLERWSTPVNSGTDVAELLKSKGAPDICYVLSDMAGIDGQEMSLQSALREAVQGGSGTIIGCTPGRLAFYLGEDGEQQLLLEKPPKH